MQWGTRTHKVMKVGGVITGEKNGFSEKEKGAYVCIKRGEYGQAI